MVENHLLLGPADWPEGCMPGRSSTLAHGKRHDAMDRKKSPARLSWRWPSLIAILLVTSTLAFGQGATSGATPGLSQDLYGASKEKLPTLEEPYHPITPRQAMRWFTTSTIGPAHLAGVAFQSACGTAINRPPEYGPHWNGFARRFGVGMAGSVTSNAIEAGIGLILREDPRYFRVPRRAFKSRVANVATLTFLARNESGRSEPAYARYLGIIGGNFLSNSWRVHSQANAQAALVGASVGLAGRMAANAFQEFWPDVKRYVFHQPDRLAAGNPHD